MFVLNYWLGEFLLSEIANHFELRCESKQLMLLYAKSALVVHKAYRNDFKQGFRGDFAAFLCSELVIKRISFVCSC